MFEKNYFKSDIENYFKKDKVEFEEFRGKLLRVMDMSERGSSRIFL